MVGVPSQKRGVGGRILSREKSRAKSQEPRAKSQEPRAKSQEPRAKSQEPRAKSQEPRAKSQEPEYLIAVTCSILGFILSCKNRIFFNTKYYIGFWRGLINQ